MSVDNTNLRKDDLRVVLKEVGFDFDEIYSKHAGKDQDTH